jgi:hypothetical protein
MADDGQTTINGEEESLGSIVIGIFPRFLRLELAADSAFRD